MWERIPQSRWKRGEAYIMKCGIYEREKGSVLDRGERERKKEREKERESDALMKLKFIGKKMLEVGKYKYLEIIMRGD